MSILRGEDINVGIGLEGESARGTFVEAQNFIPGKSPAGVKLTVKKALLKETRSSGVASQGAEIVQKQVEGNLEFNLRSQSIGYILKSLLGDYSKAVFLGAVKHTFGLQTCDPQFPTLSLSLAVCGDFQDYGYNNCLVKSLEIKTPIDDLVVGTAEFIGNDEVEKSAFDVAFEDEDYVFRPQDIEIKIADDVAGLSSAEAINLKEFSFKISNEAKPQFHIGSITPTDNIAGLLNITGDMTIDYENSDYHDIFVAGEYKAMQIKFLRDDIDIGTTNPSITFILPKISFEGYDSDRPIDDVVSDKLSFVAHHDNTEEKAITVEVVNEVVEYEPEAIS